MPAPSICWWCSTPQRQSLAARDALVQSQVGQATALVAIYRALGGGWTEVPPAAVAQR